MMTLTQLQQHQQEIYQLSQQYHVVNPRVFGSVLRGDQTADSDLDILVDATKNTTLFDIGGLQQDLTKLLGMPVEVVTPEDLSDKFRLQVLSSARAV